jgi:hypothetical protein
MNVAFSYQLSAISYQLSALHYGSGFMGSIQGLSVQEQAEAEGCKLRADS